MFCKRKKKHQFIRLCNRVELEFLQVKTHNDFSITANRFNRLYRFYNNHFSYFFSKEIDEKIKLLNKAFKYADEIACKDSTRRYIKDIMALMSEIPNCDRRYEIYKEYIMDKDAMFSIYPDNAKMVDVLTNYEIIELSMLLNERFEKL